jgi:hypothetical protein
MKYRLDVHFGERTQEEIDAISLIVSKRLGMDVYLVKDYITSRRGLKITPQTNRVEGDWRKW